jgi:hypothetical protein
MLDTEGAYINALEGSLVFPDTLLSVDVHDGGSIISLWVERPHIQENKIIFSGLIPGGYSGSQGVVVTLVLKGTQVGTGDIVVERSSFFLHNEEGTAVEGERTSTPIVVDATLGAPIVERTDNYSPEPFGPRIDRDPGLFNGAFFAVFSTQDKHSGLAYYEVQESKKGVIDERAWQKATSPYQLEGQLRASTLFVKAVDRAGNVRIEKVEFGGDKQLFNFLLIVLLCAIVGIGWYVWSIHRRRT